MAGYAIQRQKIPDYFTEEFGLALRIWSDYKKFGLPYAGGWARQPAHLIKIIRVMENEHDSWQAKKQQQPVNVAPRGGRRKK